jgi:3-hydroxyisobutyrate dehydrogenase-like beta-hydroxyacid dehydrogenase
VQALGVRVLDRHETELIEQAMAAVAAHSPTDALVLQGLAEGLNFATRAGLDGAKLIETISKGAAQSWQMENRASTMLAGKFDFGFAVDWMRKDLGICLAEAKRNGARLPLTALVDQFYAQVQARGGKRWDTSSLMHLLVKD